MSSPSAHEMMRMAGRVRGDGSPSGGAPRAPAERVWTLDRIVQFAQLAGIIGGVIVIIFAVGRRDQLLTDLVETQKSSSQVMTALAERLGALEREVSGIHGELRNRP